MTNLHRDAQASKSGVVRRDARASTNVKFDVNKVRGAWQERTSPCGTYVTAEYVTEGVLDAPEAQRSSWRDKLRFVLDRLNPFKEW